MHVCMILDPDVCMYDAYIIDPESGFLMQETSLDLDVSKVGKISTKLKNHGAPDGLCTQCQIHQQNHDRGQTPFLAMPQF